ncbi:tetratricopeptide repeat protein [Oscillatoria sp. FACHB-1406]|uniref:tetratricopeptide repeat protein n=1 Tax=Oscillatoria sp. FACHB-1406 TaxID=2692846 RepID=UPI001686AE7C|nr:tetratricopeptide repeat protein [Oscillatoria sp. FACHB-1406]MBD2578210.1 tetratricopeptide repeat protein [Oscillatoria sp. FACHB-1406]
MPAYTDTSQSKITEIAQSSFEDISDRSDRAWKLLGTSQFQEAINEFSRVIELDANFPQAYLGRGKAYREAGDYQASIQDLSTQIQVDPFGAAYYERGLTYQALGEPRRALEDFNQAIASSTPDYEFVADAYRRRGLIRQDLGDINGATEDFRESQEIYRKLGITPPVAEVLPQNLWQQSYTPSRLQWLFINLSGKGERTPCGVYDLEGRARAWYEWQSPNPKDDRLGLDVFTLPSDTNSIPDRNFCMMTALGNLKVEAFRMESNPPPVKLRHFQFNPEGQALIGTYECLVPPTTTAEDSNTDRFENICR